ncbi:MAG: acyl-CoA dehydrogenase family protein [Sphingobium sp.]
MTMRSHNRLVQPALPDERLVERLAELGRKYDAAPRWPEDSMKLLSSAGLHRRFAPVEAGGEAFEDVRAEMEALLQTLREIGRGDLSVGRLFEGHVNALHLFSWHATQQQMAKLRAILDAGGYLGVWATEPAPGVTVSEDRGRMILHGSKCFASGAGGLSHALITASGRFEGCQLLLVPANDADRADLSGWRVRGMRATTSGVYDFTGLALSHEALLGRPGDYHTEPHFTAGAWRFLAVQLGGIEALLIETRKMLTQEKREAPLMRARFADAVVAGRTAFLWVRESMLRACTGDPDGPAFVSLARGAVERAGLDVIELASRMIGTRSAFDGERADKIIRDLSLYLRQASPDEARDRAAQALLERDVWGHEDRLW